MKVQRRERRSEILRSMFDTEAGSYREKESATSLAKRGLIETEGITSA